MIRPVVERIVRWLTLELDPPEVPLCDFERLRYEVRPGDVLLIEGRSRVSEVIKLVTQSPWSHAALYIGRLHDTEDPPLRGQIGRHYSGDPDTQLVIEAVLGRGVIVTPLSRYLDDHIRICRPRGIARRDAQRVIAYAIRHLGTGYDVRQMLDLARFLLPWSILPRRWRSSLFTHRAGGCTRTLCSTLLAEAFASVQFPILPVVKRGGEHGLQLFKRNPRLYTPRDFDYSPYFQIIKYPIVDTVAYRHLPWYRPGEVVCNDTSDCGPQATTPAPAPRSEVTGLGHFDTWVAMARHRWRAAQHPATPGSGP